jgi:hypothetical protein
MEVGENVPLLKKNSDGGITSIFKDLIKSIVTIFTSPTIPKEAVIKFVLIFVVILIVTLIGYLIYIAITKSKEESPVTNKKVLTAIQEQSVQLETQLSKVGGLDGPKPLYGDLINRLSVREQYLLNLAPLTANVGGYIGPKQMGVFHVDLYLRKALRAGVRCFILPISTYIDDNKRPPLFPFSGKPAIVFRDENGTITSRNALTVKKFITSLMSNLYQNPAQANEPIILFLVADQQHLPDPVTQERAYVSVMRDLAEECNALGRSALKTLGTYGSATGGRREREILTETSLNDLKNKVLVATTFNTQLQLKNEYRNMSPKLFEQCNFLPSFLSGDPEKQNPQANILQGSSTSNSSKNIRLADVIGSKVNWVDQTRTVLHACLQDSSSIVPTVEQVKEGLQKGIQVIPIPFFYLDDMETVKKIQRLWDGYGWKLKEGSARYTKPAPIQPAPANPKMNARASANLQPGQMVVR